MEQSIRNELPGTVKSIVSDKVLSEVIVETSIGEIASVITTRSVQEMNLMPGDKVFALVKATNVHSAARSCSGWRVACDPTVAAVVDCGRLSLLRAYSRAAGLRGRTERSRTRLLGETHQQQERGHSQDDPGKLIVVQRFPEQHHADGGEE